MDRPGSISAASDRRLLDALDRGFAEIRRRAGPYLLCAPGCSECCFGPFPITRLDVRRLLSGLARADPSTAAAIVADARDAIETLRQGFPGDAGSGRLAPDTNALDRFFSRHARLPCPVLDKTTGTCRLWEDRPVACRTYGPPLAFTGAPAPHCKLCFVHAPDETIEACRWAPDPDGLERAALRELGVEGGDDWEMLIAHALGQGT